MPTIVGIYDSENHEWLERYSVDATEMLSRAPSRYSLTGPGDARPPREEKAEPDQ